jgi:hypothetical protein
VPGLRNGRQNNTVAVLKTGCGPFENGLCPVSQTGRALFWRSFLKTGTALFWPLIIKHKITASKTGGGPFSKTGRDLFRQPFLQTGCDPFGRPFCKFPRTASETMASPFSKRATAKGFHCLSNGSSIVLDPVLDLSQNGLQDNAAPVLKTMQRPFENGLAIVWETGPDPFRRPFWGEPASQNNWILE